MEGNRKRVWEWEDDTIKATKSKEKEKAKAQTTWEQCNGQISALPLPLTLALCSEDMMPQDAHHWIGNNILRVDKVRGKEQRHANCAGYFRWTVRTHTPADCIFVGSVASLCSKECCAWENGCFQNPAWDLEYCEQILSCVNDIV